jgi:hypothetical protein|tara:strand:- start:137 stop:325 length:189 start_codon:yes stop_codon:yes gene_type:complete
MKKSLSSCSDCSDETSILTQVSSGPEITLLCSDCYNNKYLKEIKTKLIMMKKIKIQKIKPTK